MNTKNANTSTTGGRIKYLREINNMTQEQLNEMQGIEVDSKRISKLENGHTEPNCQELRAFSKIFRVTTDYILLVDTEAAPSPVLTPEEQGFILALAKKIKTCQNGNPTCE